MTPWLKSPPSTFVLCAGISSRLPACASRSIFASLIITCLQLTNSSGTQAIIKWQSYDSSHHAVPRLAGHEKFYYIIDHLIQTHCKSWRLYHITCTLCKNKLDRHLDGLLQILSWLISRLHANVVPYTNQTRYFIVASLTFGVRVATNATSQTSFNAWPPCGFEFIKSTSPFMWNFL